VGVETSVVVLAVEIERFSSEFILSKTMTNRDRTASLPVVDVSSTTRSHQTEFRLHALQRVSNLSLGNIEAIFTESGSDLGGGLPEASFAQGKQVMDF